MLSHRQNNVLKATSGSATEPQFAASYVVYVFSVGARANAASSDTTPTVDAGHSFVAGDKALIWDGSASTFVAEALSAATATGLTYAAATPTIASGDLLVNLGPDTASGATPAFDAGKVTIYSDPDGSTAITGNKVTTDASGNYDYYHRGDGRFWEVITDASGTVVSVIDGFAAVDGRLNVVDFGARGDGTTDDAAAIQSAETVGNNISLYFHEGLTFLIKSTITFDGTSQEVFGRGTIKASAADLGSGGIMFSITGTNVRIRDVTLDQNNTATGRSIDVNGATNTRIENVKSANVQQAFVRLSGAPVDTWIVGCHHSSRGYGVLVNDTDSGAAGLYVMHNHFVFSQVTGLGDGVQINCPTNGFTRFIVSDNRIEDYIGNSSNAGIGIGCDNSTNGVIANNVVIDSEADGIHVEDSSDVSIIGNVVHDSGMASDVSGSAAIATIRSDRCIVSNNNIETTTELHGIYCAAETSGSTQEEDNIICNNIIKDADDAGIVLHGQDSVICSGNRVIAADSQSAGDWAGIDLRRIGTSTADNTRVVVTDNICSDGGTAMKYGIECAAGTTGQIKNNDVSACSNTLALNGASVEVSGNLPTSETATGTYTLSAFGVTAIDSSGGAVTGTLGSGHYRGQVKVIVMTNATASSTVSVTNHETSDPEVITFAAVDDTAVLMWTDTEWITLKLSGATV